MREEIKEQLTKWAEIYNDPAYFLEDPIIFPREFASLGSSLQDIEIASVFTSHLAWGRRSMIVKDCKKLFDYMEWKPLDYVMSGAYRDDDTSIHRTIKWSEIAQICCRLKRIYTNTPSLESLSVQDIRTMVFGQKNDPKAANKKINLMRRWLVRRDGKVDLGLWRESDPATLVIPLDVHVYDQASALGLTSRKAKDSLTAEEITNEFKQIWPEDPLLGDFALFGYGVTHKADA